MSTSGIVRLAHDANRSDVDRLVGTELAGVRDCVVAGVALRQLGHLLDYSDAEGLEIRDPVGYCLHYASFLRLVPDETRDGRKTHRPWCIEVLRPSVAATALVIQKWGPKPEGRRIVFKRGRVPGSERRDRQRGFSQEFAE